MHQDTMSKKLARDAASLRPMATGRGGCIATDMIMVHGMPVGFMERRKPVSRLDSGWVFRSDTETGEYLNDPANLGVYDVNTVANYDPGITPYLDAPVGSAFERDAGSGTFVPVGPPRHE